MKRKMCMKKLFYPLSNLDLREIATVDRRVTQRPKRQHYVSHYFKGLNLENNLVVDFCNQLDVYIVVPLEFISYR